jgi:hypothetical protein
MSPILSGTDYTGNKKRFLQIFCYLGHFSDEFILLRDKTPCGLSLGTDFS